MPLSERDKMLIERIMEDYDVFEKRIEYSKMNEDRFCNDHSFEGEFNFDAIMNPLYRIVEDTGHLSEELTANAPDLPWQQIAGFRNFIAHGYAQLDRKIVWKTIKNDLPSLIDYLRASANENLHN